MAGLYKVHLAEIEIERETGKRASSGSLTGLASFAVALGYFVHLVPMHALVAMIIPGILSSLPLHLVGPAPIPSDRLSLGL